MFTRWWLKNTSSRQLDCSSSVPSATKISWLLLDSSSSGKEKQATSHSSLNIEHSKHLVSPSSVSNSVCSDAVAMDVTNDDEVFPGGVTSDLCLMHQTMKIGQTGVGQLERTKMKVIQNEFVEDKKIYNMVHRLDVFFSYSDRFRELYAHCVTTKCVKIRLKLDLNTTRVTVIWALLMSVLRMKSGIVVYTDSLRIVPNELDLVHQDFIDMVIFETVLNITRVTTTLTQHQQHCNRAYRTLYKFQALQQLWQDYLWVIEGNRLLTTEHEPRV